jgi:hypothetical protein
VGSSKLTKPNAIIKFQNKIISAAFDEHKQKRRLEYLDFTFIQHPLPSNGVSVSSSYKLLVSGVIERL